MGDGKRAKRMKRKKKGERKNVQTFVSAAVRSKVRRYDSKTEAKREKERERKRDERLTKTGSQGKDCKVGSGRSGRGRERRVAKNERENASAAREDEGRTRQSPR